MIASLVLSRWNDVAIWSLANEPQNATEYKRLLSWESEQEPPTWDELQTLWPEIKAEVEAQQQAMVDARMSAIAKLQALGLTVDEVQIAFGLKA